MYIYKKIIKNVQVLKEDPARCRKKLELECLYKT